MSFWLGLESAPYRRNAAPPPQAAERLALEADRARLRAAERMALYLWVPLAVVALLFVAVLNVRTLQEWASRVPEAPKPEPCVERVVGERYGNCHDERQRIEVSGGVAVCRCPAPTGGEP